MSCDQEVLAATVQMIREAQQHVPWYAGDFAPLRTDQLAKLGGLLGCRVETLTFESSEVAFTLPMVGGVFPVLVRRDTGRTDRLFAVRHELGHVLRGEVAEPTYLTASDEMSHAERCADLFALADLVPGWMITDLRRGRGRMRWSEVKDEMVYAVQEMASAEWPAERVVDRAGLRLALYRRFGI